MAPHEYLRKLHACVAMILSVYCVISDSGDFYWKFFDLLYYINKVLTTLYINTLYFTQLPIYLGQLLKVQAPCQRSEKVNAGEKRDASIL